MLAMTTLAPPRIFTGTYGTGPLSWTTRALAGLSSLACLAVLVTAAWLSPNPTGLNTHRQLGLAPCAMLETYGVPCPTCGMTTSFTYLVHGHPLASLAAQPAGTVLCALTCVAFWACGYAALTGRPGGALARRLDVTGPLIALLAVVLVGWAYKIAIVVHAGHG